MLYDVGLTGRSNHGVKGDCCLVSVDPARLYGRDMRIPSACREYDFSIRHCSAKVVHLPCMERETAEVYIFKVSVSCKICYQTYIIGLVLRLV